MSPNRRRHEMVDIKKFERKDESFLEIASVLAFIWQMLLRLGNAKVPLQGLRGEGGLEQDEDRIPAAKVRRKTH